MFTALICFALTTLAIGVVCLCYGVHCRLKEIESWSP